MGINLREEQIVADVEADIYPLEIETRYDAFVNPNEPLILDLDGNGLTTSSVEEGIYLDIKDDGFAELNAWAANNAYCPGKLKPHYEHLELSALPAMF